MERQTDCLRRASVAYLHPRSGGRDERLSDVEELHAFGVLSNANISAITGVPESVVATVTRKADKIGGRLAPYTLPLMVRIADDWEVGVLSRHLLRAAVDGGTSQTMLAKLTGIPEHTVRRALR